MSSSLPTNLSTTALPNDPLSQTYSEAFDSVRREIDAVPDEKLVPITVDVHAASVMVLGIAQALRAHRDAAAVELPRFTPATFDQVVTYAYAAVHADTRWRGISEPKPELQAKGVELDRLYELLLSDVKNLSMRKLLDGERLKKLRGGTGYMNRTFDTLLLLSMLKENSAAVGNKSTMDPEQIQRAEELAREISVAFGQREHKPEEVTEANQTRQRAFSLFVSSYDQVRRAITYLRWNEGDADQVAPSLFASRAAARKSGTDEPEVPLIPVGPTSPVIPIATPITQPIVTGGPNDDPFVG